MRRVILALLGTAAGTTLLVGAKGPMGVGHTSVAVAPPDSADSAGEAGTGGDDAVPSGSPRPLVAASGSAAARPSASAARTGAAATPTTAAGGLPAGTYVVTGPVVSHKYGPVQVRISVSGGKITDVVAVQLPSSHSESVQINSRAAPKLRQEALTAQSANIATVSGATLTSGAYRSSLQGALDAAVRGQRG